MTLPSLVFSPSTPLQPLRGNDFFAIKPTIYNYPYTSEMFYTSVDVIYIDCRYNNIYIVEQFGEKLVSDNIVV